MARRSKYSLPAGGAVQPEMVTDAQPEGIRPQITQMSGFTTIDEVVAEAPDSTQTGADERPKGPNGRSLRADGTERAPRKKKAGTATEDGPMNDPRYRKAVVNMNFFGAPRLIKRGFKTVAQMTKDRSLDLNEQEAEAIDDYFYAVSKHTSFDPMASIVGRVILLVLLIGELVMTRVLVRSELGKQLKEMMTREPDTTAVQDNRDIRASGQREDAFGTATDNESQPFDRF